MFKEIDIKSNYISNWFNNYRLNKSENFANFDAYLLDKEFDNLVSNDVVLNSINKQFTIKRLCILGMKPNTLYPPHVDDFKRCKVNMLLTTEHISHCCFLDDNKVTEVPYKKDHMYILDTTKQHMIINFDKSRYLFSVLFENTLTYDELAEFDV